MTCIVCGARCTPMADHEPLTVCHHCDASRDGIILGRQAPTVVAVLDRARTIGSYYGPAAPSVIEDLVDALFPRDRASTGRRAS